MASLHLDNHMIYARSVSNFFLPSLSCLPAVLKTLFFKGPHVALMIKNATNNLLLTNSTSSAEKTPQDDQQRDVNHVEASA